MARTTAHAINEVRGDRRLYAQARTRGVAYALRSVAGNQTKGIIDKLESS